jgi:hypothetical protein
MFPEFAPGTPGGRPALAFQRRMPRSAVTDEPETWTIEHFSQANPEGPGQDDVPALLRRVAATLETLGTIQVQDVVFHLELTADAGDRPSLTVYSTASRVRPLDLTSVAAHARCGVS